MKNDKKNWSKEELEVYVLLLCANADKKESQEELDLIRTKVDKDCFKKIYGEFSTHSEDESLKRISECVSSHEYSYKELCEIREKMRQVFYSDQKYGSMEQNLEKILNKIIY